MRGKGIIKFYALQANAKKETQQLLTQNYLMLITITSIYQFCVVVK